ncbi:capsular polysaccharide biosynthesis protein [Shewanella corallii]|uniref:Capsular polysaccharide biosynthesis protein n=1 Tax=Shewanella corallii TaxID=560080 RepID=A0ABT0N6V7_9GAMM|nr:capsular polysaccharide biosynthesis protein [Shewanella corallii]MCL2914168.1 capsular polysaccharide biosynthesis protein [Shewanella corallii]
MTLYTRSTGIMTRSSVLQACLGQPLARYSPLSRITESDGFVGWGNKANSAGLEAKAKSSGVPFIRLEDGFIGYTGHPANGGQSLSVVVDDEGIYYDGRMPSRLESLIAKPLCAEETSRVNALQNALIKFGITKYNCYANPSAHLELPEVLDYLLAGAPYVLLVDQVAGDLSLEGAEVSEADLISMITDARAQYPHAKLLIRAHPDTLYGNKKGLLSSLKDSPLLTDVIWFAAPCHPHALIRGADAIFTLSSQLGFEALILSKTVHCYGLPFYAGWGLTRDAKPCQRRKELAPHGASLEQLMYGALVRYARYYHPVLERRCEVEDAIEVIRTQQVGEPKLNKLYLLGFSMWKRAFMGDFCRHLATEIQFVSKSPYKLNRDEKLLVWGNRFDNMHQVLRAEDGFIRSAGLGSNLCRPSSVVIDSQSMYFNAQRPNNLRQMLNTAELTQEEISRGEKLCRLLVEADINKYNLSQNAEYLPDSNAAGKQKLLVVGQVDGDASTVTGSPIIQTNEQLLWAVREAYPDAWIIYKPHPDVVAGNRQGQLSAECQQQCVDELVDNLTLNTLYPQVDELHTMTSLSGFEALLRDKKVVTWGQPFYAGWGLTEDNHPANDRLRARSLAELVFIALVKYPIYIDWDSGLYSSPEWMTAKFASRKAAANLQQSRWRRWQLKLNYLMETLSKG